MRGEKKSRERRPLVSGSLYPIDSMFDCCYEPCTFYYTFCMNTNKLYQVLKNPPNLNYQCQNVFHGLVGSGSIKTIFSGNVNAPSKQITKQPNFPEPRFSSTSQKSKIVLDFFPTIRCEQKVVFLVNFQFSLHRSMESISPRGGGAKVPTINHS